MVWVGPQCRSQDHELNQNPCFRGSGRAVAWCWCRNGPGRSECNGERIDVFRQSDSPVRLVGCGDATDCAMDARCCRRQPSGAQRILNMGRAGVRPALFHFDQRPSLGFQFYCELGSRLTLLPCFPLRPVAPTCLSAARYPGALLPARLTSDQIRAQRPAIACAISRSGDGPCRQPRCATGIHGRGSACRSGRQDRDSASAA